MFPSFNIYSTPLLILVLQGFVFFTLLITRYLKVQQVSYLLLSSILLITCFHQVCYTIGFMSWYDTYPTTKINYYLVDLTLLLAPLLYFYIKSITHPGFKIRTKELAHFIPASIYILLKVCILMYDSSLPDFNSVQNGYLVKNLEWKYIDPLLVLVSSSQMILYLGFTFQQYYNYRKQLQDVFANIYKIELNWIASFLYIYSFLFVYNTIQIVVNFAIVDLHWTQEWWYYFFSSIAIIFIGMKGYFTDTSKLHLLSFEKEVKNKPSKKSIITSDLDAKKSMVEDFINTNKSFLNDNINLIQLAQELNMSRAELSEVINNGFGKNFNDFINSYRIDAIKKILQDGKHQHLSLLGIAYECGFNSKATFNRVFKKLTHTSPSEYLKSL